MNWWLIRGFSLGSPGDARAPPALNTGYAGISPSPQGGPLHHTNPPHQPRADGRPRTISRPLTGWRFTGNLRDYQAEVLDTVSVTPGDPLHIVAPPGSGKTLLGLLLAARDGRRTLVLAPTVTIRQQWIRTASELADAPTAVSDDPHRLGNLTVLTYQLLSVVDGATAPFEELARLAWLDEMVADGRPEAEADAWLDRLAADNPRQHRSGIRRRSRRIRRELVQQEPAQLARVLHPNALALLERIVEHGIETLVLDECHHLLDHWAFVVAYLSGRIRERGGDPLLIGLTATLPSPDDADAYDNYTQLLSDVDYEVPTPAVVKAGHLAPYRDDVWVVEPTPAELTFITEHERRLHALVRELLASDEGIAYLVRQLQPRADGEPPQSPPRAAASRLDRASLDRALGSDFHLTRSVGSVLREIAPQHPLTRGLAPALFPRCSTDDLLAVLSRYALTQLLPDPDARELWQRTKLALADFGYHLTDRGIRRGRNPIETTLAHSSAKDRAAVEILRTELAGADGARIRAVVITDFTVHGNRRGSVDGPPAGALRCFDTLAAHPATAGLRPVLLTAQHLRVRAEDAPLIVPELARILEVEVTTEPVPDHDPLAVDLVAPGIGSGRIVAAVSELVSQGTVRLIVGTRGLLGEGWDCPPVNTLIDLTAVATSSATQQLRGRSLRLDPAWPAKVAHNWSVLCVIPPDVALDTPGEMTRLTRKHEHLWGLDASDHTAIVSGLDHALHPIEQHALARVLAKSRGATVAAVNGGTLQRLRSRAQSYADWRIGEPYAAREAEVVTLAPTLSRPVFRSGLPLALILLTFIIGTTGVCAQIMFRSGQLRAEVIPLAFLFALILSAVMLGPALVREVRQRARPAELYRTATLAVARALFAAGRINTEFGAANIRVEAAALGPEAERSAPGAPERTEVSVSGGSVDERRIVADAVVELFGPVESPRFLIRVDRGPLGGWGRALAAPLALLDRLVPQRTLLAVPTLIGRRRADAERFRVEWRRAVGACTLHEMNDAAGLALLREARAGGGRVDRFVPRHRSWV